MLRDTSLTVGEEGGPGHGEIPCILKKKKTNQQCLFIALKNEVQPPRHDTKISLPLDPMFAWHPSHSWHLLSWT